MITFISLYGCWVNIRKGESECYILLFCPQVLHATNLMKMWDWKVKQKYILIKDNNLVVTLANQKFKFDVSKIERLFYHFSTRLTGLTSELRHSQNPSEPIYPHFTCKFWSAN